MYEFKNSLGFKLNRLGVLVRRKLLHALDAWDVTPEQWQVLCVCAVNSAGISAKEICEITLLDRCSVSKILDKLEARAWIHRHPNPDDMRSTLVLPSKKLLKESSAMKESLKKEFTTAWQNFDDHQQEFSQLCSKLINILD